MPIQTNAYSTKYKIMKRTIYSSNATGNYVILTLTCLTLLLVIDVSGQDASIKLNQGTVVGVMTLTINFHISLKIERQNLIFQLKVFPEASRTPVYSYLGIPYAQPPVGKLRFAVN